MSQNISETWAAQMERDARSTVDKVFAGYPVKARRITQRAILMSGALPQPLVEHMIRLFNDSEYQAEIEQDVEGRIKDVNYQRHYEREVIESVIAEPVFVFTNEPLQLGEVRYADFIKLCPQFVDEVVRWVGRGCPDVPVALAGGESVAYEDLENFPDKERGSQRAHARGVRKDKRNQRGKAVENS